MTPKERLTVMFYIMMRDHVPVGVIASALSEHVTKVEVAGRIPTFSNGHLMAYASELAEVLLES